MDWDAPGPGVWFLTLEHFPHPISRLAAELIAPVASAGWVAGARRFGLARGRADFRSVNGWYYYSPGTEPPVVPDDAVAAETLATKRWRAEVLEWDTVERPAVLAADRALASVDPGMLDDDALRAHVGAVIDHFRSVAPIHFAHTGFDIAFGLLVEAGGDVRQLAGASTGSTDAARHLVAIAASVGGGPVATLADVAGPALDAYLADHGWRLLSGHDLDEPAVIERPELIVRGINSARPVPVVDVGGDEVLADARASYRLRDDDVQLTFTWPLGLLRRALLEVGRRRGLRDPGDIFESSVAELFDDPVGAEELAARTDARRAAASQTPPPMLGSGGPPPGPELPPNVARLDQLQGRAWSVSADRGEGELAGIPVGTGVGRGRVRRIAAAADIAEVEPGEVLVARATTTAFGPVFPIVAAVVTCEGSLLSHAAILARELGVPAVVGVASALDALADGDEVVVDGDAGTISRV